MKEMIKKYREMGKFTVQMGRKFRRLLLRINIILFPFGIMGGIATIAFLHDGYSDFGDVIGAAGTFVCAIFMLAFEVFFAKKKIYASEEGLLIEGVFKKKYFPREKLSKLKVIHAKIEIYSEDVKIVQITPMYAGYEELVNWIVSRGIPMEGIDVIS